MLTTQVFFLEHQASLQDKLSFPTPTPGFPVETLDELAMPFPLLEALALLCLLRADTEAEIPKSQFPVLGCARPENEAAFRAAAASHEPALQL